MATGEEILKGEAEALESAIARAAENAGARQALTANLERLFAFLVYLRNPGFSLEIGAHEASYSQRVRGLAPHCKIVAVEGNPDVHARHAKRLAQHGVAYENLIVGPDAGKATLLVPRRGGRQREVMGSLFAFKRDVGEDATTVEAHATTLDIIAAPLPGRGVLWVDVEGAAFEVLQGGREMLRRVDALYVEVEARAGWEGQRLDRDVSALLSEHGLVPFARDVQRRNWQYNLVFVRRDAFAPRLLDALLLAQEQAVALIGGQSGSAPAEGDAPRA